MKTFFKLFVTSLFIGVSILPTITFAADAYTDGYTPLAPIPQLLGKDGKTIDIGTFIPAIIKLGIGLAAAFALLMIFMGGIQYMSTDAFNDKKEGRSTITNAVIGLLLAIGAYSILYTVNPRLLNISLSLPYAGTTTPAGELSVNLDDPSTIDAPSNWKAGASWPSDSRVRATIKNAHIDINNENCIKIGDTGCTSLYGLSTVVGDSLIAAEKDCEVWKQSCRIRITGGTEYWLHGNRSKDYSLSAKTNHKPWGNVVDLSINTSAGNQVFHAFLKAKGTPASPDGCSEGKETYKYGRGTYVNEIIAGNDPHWHVCFN